MKINKVTVILAAIIAVVTYLWLSAPVKVVYKDSPQNGLDSLKNVIANQENVIRSSIVKVDSLQIRINELNNKNKLLNLQILNLKKDYETEIKYLNSASIDSNVIYFRSKFTEDNSN